MTERIVDVLASTIATNSAMVHVDITLDTVAPTIVID